MGLCPGAWLAACSLLGAPPAHLPSRAGPDSHLTVCAQARPRTRASGAGPLLHGAGASSHLPCSRPASQAATFLVRCWRPGQVVQGFDGGSSVCVGARRSARVLSARPGWKHEARCSSYPAPQLQHCSVRASVFKHVFVINMVCAYCTNSRRWCVEPRSAAAR